MSFSQPTCLQVVTYMYTYITSITINLSDYMYITSNLSDYDQNGQLGILYKFYHNHFLWLYITLSLTLRRAREE